MRHWYLNHFVRKLFIFLFLGAEIYVQMEIGVEEKSYAAKRERAKEVEEAANYLSSAFWWYVNDPDSYPNMDEEAWVFNKKLNRWQFNRPFHKKGVECWRSLKFTGMLTLMACKFYEACWGLSALNVC